MKYNIDLTKYENPKLINRGGYGSIYTIQEKATSTTYAAKVINIGNDIEIENNSICREIEILMFVKHPTIINMVGFTFHDFDWLDIKNNLTIIMNFYQNGSLSKLIKEAKHGLAPINYDNTLRQIILTGIARGMKYLHDRNIIHRDLNPNNILLTDDYYPLISDFGLSKIFQDGCSQKHSQNWGTVGYKAPEFIQDLNYDKKVDVYSFAIIMFQVVTDTFPYPGQIKGTYDFENKVVNNYLRPTFEIPIKPSIKQLIEKCWSKDPNERPTFEYIFEKLAYSDGKEVDDENSYFLDNVNLDIFQDYLNIIVDANDPVERLNNQIKKVEKENKILENKEKQLNNEIQRFAMENEQLQSENEKLKAEIERLRKEKQNNAEINQPEINVSQIENAFEEEEEFEENIIEDNNIQDDNIQDDNSQDDNIEENIEFDHDERNPTIKSKDFINYKLSRKYQTAFIYHSPEAKDYIFIPRTIKYNKKDYTIIGISGKAFANSNILTLDFCEDSDVQYIGNLAFQKSMIENIFIPPNLHKIEPDWIEGAENLKTIEINGNNRHFIDIKGFIIYKNNGNRTIVFSPLNYSGEYPIPNCITHIGISSFVKRNELRAFISKTSKIQEIGQCSFLNCNELERINIKGSTPLILHELCFSETKKLTNAELESNEIIINKSSFSNCSSLTTVKLKKTNKVVLNSLAFYQCSKLNNFSISNETEYDHMNNYSFKVSDISSITIKYNCFKCCSKITSVIFFNVNEVDLSMHSFNHCNDLKKIEIINSTNIKISKDCFYNLKQLESLSFDVKNFSIETDFFSKCPLLNTLSFSSPNDLTINSNTFPTCTTITNLIISTSSKLKLYNHCFNKLKNLKLIEISFKSIQICDKNDISISNNIFNDCEHLTELRIITDLPLQIKNPFMKMCKSLQNLYLSGEIVSVENECFSECSSLANLHIRKTGNFQICNNEFSNYPNIKEIALEIKYNNDLNETPKYVGHGNICRTF